MAAPTVVKEEPVHLDLYVKGITLIVDPFNLSELALFILRLCREIVPVNLHGDSDTLSFTLDIITLYLELTIRW
ncbi:hypothetical protein ETB97_002031 [Aspergillus alliaceus]|uniref:Uncharacterized protein n=1 Tax=Petromyces alliaceus TaxID=209559 RepID=A0A8H6A350_PETAA|nr:hypothetical protein ETB97_002031 [Aspergillus burnettii]